MDKCLVATLKEFANEKGLQERFTAGKGDSPIRAPVIPVAADPFVEGLDRKDVTRFAHGAGAACRGAGKSRTCGTDCAVDEQFRGSRSFPGGGLVYRDGI